MTLDQLAQHVGCTGVVSEGGQLLTREAGYCTLGGEDIYLHTHTDAAQQADWLEAATSMAGGIYVVGDLWTVQTFDQASADSVAEATGGEVQG